MRLTLYSDYSLRTLIYLAVNPGRLVSIAQVSTAYAISQNHIVKVVHNLGKMGVVATTRGRGGGMRLARPPEQINLGELIRKTEPTATLVECFDVATNTCRLAPCCDLKGIFFEAQEAFLQVLDRHSLASLISQPLAIQNLLQLTIPPPKG